MKKIVLLVLALFTLLLFSSNIIGADNNLVQNNSFENGTESTPAFWQIEAWDKAPETTEYKHESGNAHSGSKCVTIINNKENDSRYIQPLNVSENKMYMLSCWIKASGIQKDKKGANISLEGKLESSADVWETDGQWQQVAMYAKTGPGITTFTVTVGIGTYGSTNTGRASFDDVSVVEVSSIPDGAAVCNLSNEQQQSGDQNNNNAGGNNGSTTSIFGWILFIGIFVVIIVFVLYRSVTKNAPQEPEPTDTGDLADGSPPAADTTTEEQADAPAKEKETKQSDDLL
jgi:hypothetical protein